MASLSINAGTIVFNKRNQQVTLACRVIVDDAVRQSDGSYSYKVGRDEYIASAGTVHVLSDISCYRDALVSFS